VYVSALTLVYNGSPRKIITFGMGTKMKFRALCASAIFIFICAASFAQTRCETGKQVLDSEYPRNLSPEEIIQKFAANEYRLKQARNQYTYVQDVKIQTFYGPNVDGEYRQVADVSFDPDGKRIERVTFAPQSSLRSITISNEDIEDIRTFTSFFLTPEMLPKYRIRYEGQQREDELHTYVFDVEPVDTKSKTRSFKGRVWVDDQDFQIVKTCGKSVPDVIEQKGKGRNGASKNVLPTFVTYRQFVDDRYWFPAYSRSDEVLTFPRFSVPIREIVKFTNYRSAGTTTGQESGAKALRDQEQTTPK
jgi:hypothetical protein